MHPTKATRWSPARDALRSSNDNGRLGVDPGSMSLPSKSAVTRIALAGPIEEGLIASLLQMWANAASSGKLEVSTGKEEGVIELVRGSIVHAQIGPALGQAACFRILSLTSGEFRYRADHTHDEPATPAELGAAREEIQGLLLAWVRIVWA